MLLAPFRETWAICFNRSQFMNINFFNVNRMWSTRRPFNSIPLLRLTYIHNIKESVRKLAVTFGGMRGFPRVRNSWSTPCGELMAFYKASRKVKCRWGVMELITFDVGQYIPSKIRNFTYISNEAHKSHTKRWTSKEARCRKELNQIHYKKMTVKWEKSSTIYYMSWQNGSCRCTFEILFIIVICRDICT